MARARVLIRNKKGVFDPEGKVIHSSLERLGHEGVEQVRVGKVVDLEFANATDDEIRAQVDEMCRQFLVNPVIEDYSLEIIRE